jgi:hypothetical protein
VQSDATTTAPAPTFEYSNDAPATNTPVITQDKDDDEEEPPSANYSSKLRSQSTRTVTDEWLYSMMEFPGITTTFTNTVTPQMAASRKYPMQLLCDYANAAINNKTGEIMEYQHLLKDPKHRERWQRLFSKEIWRLATTTETVKLLVKT